jgi:type VI secretion system Hcp family effector
MWGYRVKTTLASAVLALALLHSPPARALDLQGPFFISISGVQGESTQKAHTDEIEAFNFSETWRQSTTAGGAGGGTSKPTLGPVVFDKLQTPSSLKLLGALLTGKHFDTVRISFWAQGAKGEERLFYRITLQTVSVVGMNEKSLGTGLVDEVQLMFESAKWEVFDPPDSVTFDGKTGKAAATTPASGRSTR